MKIILIRHGKTIENEEGILQGGQMQGHLSKLGIQQSKELALKLKNEEIDYIYSSNLNRTIDTAKEIAKYYPKIPIKSVKELRERDFGEFTGIRKSDLGYPKDKLIGDILKISEGETIEEVKTRIKKILNKLQQEHKEDTILIVGHNSVNKIIISLILNKPLTEVKPQDNLEINIFKI